MAALTQQQTEIEEKGAARAFWDRQMQKHPNIHGILNIISSLFGFFFNGHFVVAIGHWLVVTAGRIAETALLLATLWITAANVAPDLVGKLGSENVASLNSLSLIAFSLLPEIIVFSAIIVTYQHWGRFIRDRRPTNPAWLWATLYTLPTGSFIIMTILTISSFVSHDGTAGHATGTALVARCLSGWFYSLVELIYASIGKRHFQTYTAHQVEDRMAEIVATTRTAFENALATLTTNTQQQLNNQVANIQHQITQKLASEVTSLVATASTQLAIPGNSQQEGITSEQFNMLVELINQQATTIRQLSNSLAEVRREVRTTVTEIRSFTQETPATIQGPTHARALPAGRTTVEIDTAEINESGTEKPGQRVLRFLQECQARQYKPTLLEIQQVCHVAKRTATTYRQSFYEESESSQADEADEEEQPRHAGCADSHPGQ